MNTQEARTILLAHLRDWYAKTWAELRSVLNRPQAFEITGPSGVRYQVEIEAHWDGKPEGDIRVLGAIDDGGWRAFKPLCEDFIKSRGRGQISGQ